MRFVEPNWRRPSRRSDYIIHKYLAISCSKMTVKSFYFFAQQLYSKYKYMEGSFERNKVSYKSKIPDIEQTLELIKIMKKKRDSEEEMFTNYSLCDTIYAKAKV